MSIITVIDIIFEIASASIHWRFDLQVSMQENVVQSKQTEICRFIDSAHHGGPLIQCVFSCLAVTARLSGSFLRSEFLGVAVLRRRTFRTRATRL